ncbi:flagellar hook-associated protein FlgK [Shewanella sp. D64]|uniref:flagellar hook-associated protein FlgK n=1 Tax=unclassified Shewanella TaxID=196818 RepID=UPI0022BA3CFA|nr:MULTISPECIES: flagellar hook-associated protein FlgK [unclassified Shewanella]MEC4726523.1 flagellar hook-associated protein FlgK [Shewanella sp. D64]MEC4737436.1 flagellar hook-associated protein FlgK [Shewanella sp. E94]WBJ97252.1 flagellar hook-associated protein FlgK [Shewanella sp. MTB7]
MGMDLLNIARTGVLAAQSQLAVTSNNITNANTQGYHRQVAEQSSLDNQQLGGNFYGAGTYISDVKRIYNDYAARELRIGQTSVSGAQTSQVKLNELDQLFSQIGKSVPQGLNDLFAGLNSLADLPDDLGIRGSVLGSANQLASGLNQMQSHLDGQMKQTNDQISGITDRINEIGKELGHINQELMKSQGEDMSLLDKQDALIQELSQYSQVNVIPLDTGAKSVMLGGAVMLVSGEVSMSIGTTVGDPYPGELRVTSSAGSATMVIDPTQMGGQLGALFEFRDDTLVQAQLEIGQLALGVADAFNQAQSQGFDLSGALGKNIFTDINDPSMSVGRVGGFGTNTGNVNLRVNIDDTSALNGSSYDLTFTTPATYELKDTSTGVVTPLILNGTQLDGGDGFSIHIDSGAFADGDKFEIRPSAGAAAGIKVEMTDPKGIAAAGPNITVGAANSGNTQVEIVSIDRNNANLPLTGSELTYQIDPVGNTFTVFDASGTLVSAAAPYTPPTITSNGFSFNVNTTSTSTESFTFDFAFAEGDNSNAVAMAKLSEAKLMNTGGSNTSGSTLADVYEGTKLVIGGKAKAASVAVGSAEAVFSQAYNRVQSESGVNLDEEAGNLIRFQQAYQASARIMTTASEIFDTLFNSVR